MIKSDVLICYSSRRSMITNAFLGGYTDAQVMQMSGHKDLKMLLIYSNFANNEILKKNLAKKLEELRHYL